MSFSFSPSSCIRTRPFCREQKRLLSKQFYSHGSKTGILRRRLLSGGIALTVCFSLLNEGSVRVVRYFDSTFRYNIPELAKKYKVYALDLLGFGWSEKAIIEYDATIWKDQVADFMKDIVKEPAILVGNSLGGFTALFTASELPQLVRGLVLLNTAGQFRDSNLKPVINNEESAINKYVVNPVKQAFQRVFLRILFWQAKQPSRVKSVLQSVYINTSNVDDYLVESITRPAGDPNAGEVYYRLMTRFMIDQSNYTLDSILQKLSCPLLLLWGDLDPWVRPAKAVRIKEFYPNTSIVNLKAGHCPHDEVPELVNNALIDWLTSLDHEASF
ncbi:hypothetical protein KFK09_028296 [Dendrobium nobile]|uniref:AB hydrolase-1 domain-containing protein n=1 Tax=Dendrobium nobile TaxID=94219 RepID=A0A8T3A718_DENNO|nr:hypothetical protein KFK09_028296 [Dendrobium nobile]